MVFVAIFAWTAVFAARTILTTRATLRLYIPFRFGEEYTMR